MSIVVNNNIASLVAQRNLNSNTNGLVKSMERLSSGLRINKASDDAAGLSISENLRTQVRGNNQAINNVQDCINMISIAEGSLSVITENIQRIRELTVQAANDTNDTAERGAIILEIVQRLEDIDRIAEASRFNQVNLLDGSLTELNLQIGANSDDFLDIGTIIGDGATSGDLDIEDSDTASGVLDFADETTWEAENFREYLDVLDAGLATVTQMRSQLGATQNRLESTLSNLQVTNENLQASESRIRDLDIARETAGMTKFQILQQASASVLTQANRIPQIALALLGG